MVRRRSVVLRAIYALCLLGATYNHAVIVAEHGVWWDYGGFPRTTAMFWTSLTLIDPAAAVLLFLRPNAGIVATATIIVVDVIHNLWVEARYFPPLLDALARAPQLIEQIGFMLFVLTTAGIAWTPAPGSRREPATD
jgi:hypothetical protein